MYNLGQYFKAGSELLEIWTSTWNWCKAVAFQIIRQGGYAGLYVKSYITAFWFCYWWQNKTNLILNTTDINPKTSGGGSIWHSAMVFRKMYLLRREWNPGFLWLLILSWVASSLNISLKFLKLFWSYKEFFYQYQLFSSIFINFLDFCKDFLVAKKLMTSDYNRWFQHSHFSIL